MSIAIGKILGGIALSGGGIVAITGTTLWLNNFDNQATKLDTTNNNNNIFIYTISEEVANKPASEEISKTGGNKNYQCKFDDEYHECEITASEVFDTTTKQWSIDKIATDAVTGAATIAKETLKTKDNIYKIKINKDIGDWTKEKEKFSIDIIPNKSNTEKDKSKKYASLKPLFALTSEYNPDPVTKTKFFVVKSNSAATSNANSTYKCLADKETIVSNQEPDKDCYVYDFSESSETNKNWHEISFKKPTTGTNSSITANKHYLVELTEEVKAAEIKRIKIKPSTGTQVALESEIIPAIYITEKPENILILKAQPTTTQQ